MAASLTGRFTLMTLLALVILSLAIGVPTYAEERAVIVEVEAGDFYFSPSRIIVPPGENVILKVRNAGSYPHTLTIEGLNVDIAIAPGEVVEVSFNVTLPGEYSIYCRYHPRMTATLVVQATTEPTATVTVTKTTTVTTTIYRVTTPSTTTVTTTLTKTLQPTPTTTVTKTVTVTITTTTTQSPSPTPPPETRETAPATFIAVAAATLLAGIALGRLLLRNPG